MSFRPSFRLSVMAVALSGVLANVLLAGQAHAAPLLVKEPNDPSHLQQWYLRDGPAGIGAYSAWAIAATQAQSQAVVGVIDTNIELANKELKNRLVTGWDGRNNQAYPVAWILGSSMHGTMVAGTLAGEANNATFGAGVAGTAPVKVMPLKYVNQEDMCGTGIKPDAATAQAVYQGMVRSMRYALDNNARVINISSAVTVNPAAMDATTRALFDQIVTLFKEAETRGVLIVTSAGNSHFDADRLATEGQVLVQGWDALPDGSNACAAPRFSMLKWESDLTTAQRNALVSGQPFDVSVKSGLNTYPVKVVVKSAAPKGSIMLPGGFSKAPYSLNNVLTVAGSDASAKMWVEPCGSGELAFATAMTDTKPQICNGSTYGSHVHIAAPSKDVLVQALGLTASMPGTSFGSPMVAAAAGLALTVRPNLNAVQLKAAITEGVNASRIKPGMLTQDDILKLPRMLASSTIGIPNPNAPTRQDVLPAPAWNATTRAYTFNDTATSDNVSRVRWDWNFGDGTTASTTTASVAHAFTLNGTYPVGLTVTDNQGNQRSFTQNFYVWGKTRDQVKLQLDGTSPYSLNGNLISGNLVVRDGLTSSQRVIEGTGVVRDTASGKNVTVTFKLSSNILGYVGAGQIDVTDPVRGKLSVTMNNGTFNSDRSIDQVTGSQASLTGQTFTGVNFTVRDTDD